MRKQLSITNCLICCLLTGAMISGLLYYSPEAKSKVPPTRRADSPASTAKIQVEYTSLQQQENVEFLLVPALLVKQQLTNPAKPIYPCYEFGVEDE